MPTRLRQTNLPNASPTAQKRFDTLGITIIELLVVIAILGLLLSMLLPTLHRGKSFAKKISCQNNLRQWGFATQLYAADYNDYLPQDGAPNGLSRHSGWYIDLPKQIDLPPYAEAFWRTNASEPLPNSVWLCPANRRKSDGLNLFHYCLNLHINGIGAGRQVKLTSLHTPSRLVWLFDNGKEAAVAQQNNVHTNVHQAAANFLYLDGHTASHSVADYWNFIENRGITNNPSIQWKPTLASGFR